MTDDSDTPVGADAAEGGPVDAAEGGPADAGPDEARTAGATDGDSDGTAPESTEARPTEPVEREELSLDDLTLPQRVFVAAVQNPSRGVFVAFLLAFAFSFYIALWLAFPRFAALGSAAAAVAAVVIGGVLYLLR